MTDSFDEVLARVEATVFEHVRSSKGFEQQSMINPLETHNSVAAFAMSRFLVLQDKFDYCISVAPEGHLYGYFFECIGSTVFSVHVDYPPRRCQVLDDLDVIAGKRILILEDDVASGTTLRLVTSALEEYQPSQMDLYLGRAKRDQTLENVDSRISKVYLSEDCLDPINSSQHRLDFAKFFAERLEV